MGNNKAWIGPNRVDLTSDTIYTHPSEIQCNASSEIESLKSSVSSGKSLIAAAVTGKGVSTAATATFQTMANNIKKIDVITDGEKEILDNLVYTASVVKSRYYRYAEVVSGSLTGTASNGMSYTPSLNTAYASIIGPIAILASSSGSSIRYSLEVTAIDALTVKASVTPSSGTYYTCPPATILSMDDTYVTFRLYGASGRAYVDSTGTTITWTSDLVIKTKYKIAEMTIEYYNCPTSIDPSLLTVTW